MEKYYFIGSKKVEIDIYNECKYIREATEETTVQYEGVEAFEVVEGERADQLEAESDGSCIDPFHEYLVRTLKMVIQQHLEIVL